jgi:hypothetical protein
MDALNSEKVGQESDSRSPWCSRCEDYAQGQVGLIAEGMRQFYGAVSYKCDDCGKTMWTASGARHSMRRCVLFTIVGAVGMVICGLGSWASDVPLRAVIAVSTWNLLVIFFLFVRPYWVRRRHLREYENWANKASLYGVDV